MVKFSYGVAALRRVIYCHQIEEPKLQCILQVRSNILKETLRRKRRRREKKTKKGNRNAGRCLDKIPKYQKLLGVMRRSIHPTYRMPATLTWIWSLPSIMKNRKVIKKKACWQITTEALLQKHLSHTQHVTNWDEHVEKDEIPETEEQMRTDEGTASRVKRLALRT